MSVAGAAVEVRSEPATLRIAEWVAGLAYEHIPAPVLVARAAVSSRRARLRAVRRAAAVGPHRRGRSGRDGARGHCEPVGQRCRGRRRSGGPGQRHRDARIRDRRHPRALHVPSRGRRAPCSDRRRRNAGPFRARRRHGDGGGIRSRNPRRHLRRHCAWHAWISHHRHRRLRGVGRGSREAARAVRAGNGPCAWASALLRRRAFTARAPVR